MQGIIKVLKNGFGFITPSETEGESDERQGDIFFHATDCNEGVFNTLNVGDTLSFEM
jgi:cold shock CspA family protein